ncbi:MAG: DNA adenine methylase [Cellulosilyticaceae bacterium]
MGSKRKSAGKIYQTIKNLNPKANKIYDLFCGGFAISEIFLKNGWEVIANDKNKYVVALIDQVVNKKLDEKKCLEWVSRELFLDVQKNPQTYEDWYVGYIQCGWSFGNNQKNYLFGKDVEKYKRAGHELVVNCNPDLLLKLIPNFSKKYIDGVIQQKDWHTRRIALLKVCTVLKTRIFELERLQQLQQLEQLEQLEQLQAVKLTSLSYDEVEIESGAIIYCDPPYKGTAEYKEGAFDHNKFWNWIRLNSKTNKVYISEYQAPADFKTVLEFEQKSSLAGGTQKHDNQPNEKLFTITNQNLICQDKK